MNIYVGNIPFATTQDDLYEIFGAYGEVTNTQVITDRETGRSRGFGFVEMADDAAANEAIEALNGSEMNGRAIVVNQARPRQSRPQGRF